MNVYDFDNTIYDGDCSIDFFLFCLKKHPQVVVYLPSQIFALIKYKLCIFSKLKFKEEFFSFLQSLNLPENDVKTFWNTNRYKIKSWYLNQKKDDDLIISASPDFLLNEICNRMNISNLIASEVDIKTGKFKSNNCYGREKRRRFEEKYPDDIIDKFYSDSESDHYLAHIAVKAFIVKGNNIEDWDDRRKLNNGD